MIDTRAEIEHSLAKADGSAIVPPSLSITQFEALNLWQLSTRCAGRKPPQNNSSFLA